MEECQMLNYREAIQLRAIAICFLMSCSLDPVLWIMTLRCVKDSTTDVVTNHGHKEARQEGGISSLNHRSLSG